MGGEQEEEEAAEEEEEDEGKDEKVNGRTSTDTACNRGRRQRLFLGRGCGTSTCARGEVFLLRAAKERGEEPATAAAAAGFCSRSCFLLFHLSAVGTKVKRRP